uniref:Uncharacterized protein n=1 Tax=Oryza brachyantha TaxID=4533 RepID=J3L0X5_ORYBR
LPVAAVLLGELLRLAHHPVDLLWLSFRSSPEMVICSDLPVALSAALTLRMPLASTSKVTSICGVPLGAGAMPVRSNLPSSRLSRVMLRSPSNTWMVTVVCLSL